MYVFSQFVARLRAVLVVFIFVVTYIMNGVEVIFKTKHKKLLVGIGGVVVRSCVVLCCVALALFVVEKERARKEERGERQNHYKMRAEIVSNRNH